MTEPRVVILVPRRDGNHERDAVWHWVKAWWRRELGWPVVEGYHVGGQFNRSAAINDAAAKAGEWDVALVIDSDMICDPPHVREAVARAHDSGGMVMPYSRRNDLNRIGSAKVMNGYGGPWEPYIKVTHYSMCSGVIAVPRRLWDAVEGFDPVFEGWGWEDNAFAVACETFSGMPVYRMAGEAWHLYHPASTDTYASRFRNQAIAQLYIAAKGDKEAVRSVRRGITQTLGLQRIPRIVHRVVPRRVSPAAEKRWEAMRKLHPTWSLVTHRDPLVPEEWPTSSLKWADCADGAQLAGLVRLEAVLRYGGVYVDEDYEPARKMDSLLPLAGFAAWEDERTVPDAVFGAVPWHPAFQDALNLAMARVPGPTWDSGPGVFTELLPGRDDVVLLPPESFYPVHYRDPEREAKMAKFDPAAHPSTFGLHLYEGSWLK